MLICLSASASNEKKGKVNKETRQPRRVAAWTVATPLQLPNPSPQPPRLMSEEAHQCVCVWKKRLHLGTAGHCRLTPFSHARLIVFAVGASGAVVGFFFPFFCPKVKGWRYRFRQSRLRFFFFFWFCFNRDPVGADTLVIRWGTRPNSPPPPPRLASSESFTSPVVIVGGR